jgi:hypothetical protein
MSSISFLHPGTQRAMAPIPPAVVEHDEHVVAGLGVVLGVLVFLLWPFQTIVGAAAFTAGDLITEDIRLIRRRPTPRSRLARRRARAARLAALPFIGGAVVWWPVPVGLLAFPLTLLAAAISAGLRGVRREPRPALVSDQHTTTPFRRASPPRGIGRAA